MNLSGSERALGAFSPLDFVESEINPFDHQPENLPSAGRIGLGHVLSKSPQMAHRGLDDDLHVPGPIGQFRGHKLVLYELALPFHGRQFRPDDIQYIRRGPEEVLGGLIDLAVKVGELTSNRGDVARAARLLTDLLSQRRAEAF